MNDKITNKELENVTGAGNGDLYCPYCNLPFPASMKGQMLQYNNHIQRHKNSEQQ